VGTNPYHSERVLVRALGDLAAVAGLHHERLDGSGYFRCLRDLPAPARLLAAADVAHALGEPRPHRPALAEEERRSQLHAEVRAGRLDGDAVECVLAALEIRAPKSATAGIAGLTPRELDVLKLVARGHSIKLVARELGIAPKTADSHIQHIYAKIGVSTRAGAALFAMRHGLVEEAE
jgi:DNA-binding CsgD family transcriptional regulator